MSVEPIKRVSVVEQAISKIYDLILSQNLKENDKLPPERQLSEMLGISRNSLREAIRVLDMLGVVRVDQGSGMVIDSSRVSDAVTKHLTFALLMNREKMNELFEARLVVETECASLAALRASESERALLEAKMMAAMAEATVGMQAARLERAVGIDLRSGSFGGDIQ